MKKIACLTLGALICTSVAFANPLVYEKPDVRIMVEGNKLELGQEVPIIVNSRTLVPLRKLLVGLGVPDKKENIEWVGDTREVKVNHKDVKIGLQIENSKGYINGKEYKLDSEPIIYKDRTYLPARFVGEALGYTISWDQYTPAVLVTSNENKDKVAKILDEMNNKMKNITTYRVKTYKRGNVETKFGEEIYKDEYASIENEIADLSNKIIYTETDYKDNLAESKNYAYNAEDGYFARYQYLDKNNQSSDTGWNAYPYSIANGGNPFKNKEKLGVITVDPKMYGSLIIKDSKDAYIISAASNHVDILKSLDGNRMFDSIFKDKVDNLDFILQVDKETKMPKKLNVVFEKNSTGIKEKIEYAIEFLEYNGQVELQLPEL